MFSRFESSYANGKTTFRCKKDGSESRASKGQRTEGYEKLAKAAALEGRQHQNAGKVIIIGRVLLFREIADHVAAPIVALGEDIKEEGLDIVVERLVVEEELGEQAQILTVDFVLLAIHLKHGEISRAVNFVTRRMAQGALELQKKSPI